MADLIDRKALTTAINNLWNSGNIIGGETVRTKVLDAIAALPAQGVTQEAHEKAVMAEKMRMMDWCGKRVGVIQRAWKRAAEKALKGDLGDLRNRVNMMDAPPLDIAQSAALAPAEAGGVESRTLPMPAPPVDVTFFRDGSIWVKPVSDAEAASPGVEPPQPGEASASGTPAPAPVDAQVEAMRLSAMKAMTIANGALDPTATEKTFRRDLVQIREELRGALWPAALTTENQTNG